MSVDNVRQRLFAASLDLAGFIAGGLFVSTVKVFDLTTAQLLATLDFNDGVRRFMNDIVVDESTGVAYVTDSL